MLRSLKANLQNELLVICIVTILLIPIVAFSPSNVPRIIIGLPFVLFFPGYTLIAALFPRRGSLSGVERAGFSVPLSIAIVSLIGLFLNYVWAITLYPILISLTVFIFVTSAIAWWRRWRLPEEERFAIAFHFSLSPWRGQGSLDKVLSIFMVVAILGAIGASAYTATKPGQPYTEFYILDEYGGTENYPLELEVGVPGEVILDIVNHENRAVNYRVEVLINGTEQDEIHIELAHGEKREQWVSLSFDTEGEDQKVEFALYKDGEAYLQPLWLWVDVTPYTEFFIFREYLEEYGGTENYPLELEVNEEGWVLLGIVNHENRAVNYRVEVLINGTEQDEIHIELAHEEEREQWVSFSFDTEGEEQKVEFALYKDGEAYLKSLWLWVDVTP